MKGASVRGVLVSKPEKTVEEILSVCSKYWKLNSKVISG